MAEPSVSFIGSPYTDDSSEVSQSSAEHQQPIVSEFPNEGPVLSKLPFGGPVEFNWPLSDPWSGFGVGEHFPPLTSSSPFLADVIAPSPRRLLRDPVAGSNMSESSHSPSEEIPTSGEYYQLFPEDNTESSVMSSPGPSLPSGYRSLGQIIATAASMGVSSPSTRPVVPSLGMSPRTLVMSSPQVTSVPVRPTVCVAASTPAITTQSVRTTSLPEDVYIASAMSENISLEENRLSLQQSNPKVGQSSQDPNLSYFSHYAQDGTPVYVFPY